MDYSRDTGIIALALVVSACLTVYFLRVAQPTGAFVEFLLSRV
jgi:hypothetical protein